MPKEQSPQEKTQRDLSSEQAIAEQDSKRLRDLLGQIGEPPTESEAGHSEVFSL
jgi:hypothetical protein